MDFDSNSSNVTCLFIQNSSFLGYEYDILSSSNYNFVLMRILLYSIYFSWSFLIRSLLSFHNSSMYACILCIHVQQFLSQTILTIYQGMYHQLWTSRCFISVNIHFYCCNLKLILIFSLDINIQMHINFLISLMRIINRRATVLCHSNYYFQSSTQNFTCECPLENKREQQDNILVCISLWSSSYLQ